MRAVVDMCNGLADAGYSVVCLTFDDTDAPRSWRDGASDANPRAMMLARAPGPRGSLGLASRDAMKRICEQVHFADVVHLHTPWAPINLQAANTASRAGVPYIVSAHGMLDDWSMSVRRAKKRAYLAICGKSLLNRAAFIHCTARAERDQAMRWFPNGEAFIAPCVFDADSYTPLPNASLAHNAYPEAFADAGPKVLFLSRLHEKKGVDILIRSFAEVLRALPDTRLLIAGPGEPRYVAQLQRLARVLGVEDRTHFLGMVHGETKLSLYCACDVLAIPTSQENFGLVFVESLACCTPVITTRGVDIWRELEATGAARIVAQLPRPFAIAILDALSDPAALRRASENGREETLRWLNPKRVVSNYVSMYEQAINGRRQPA